MHYTCVRYSGIHRPYDRFFVAGNFDEGVFCLERFALAAP